MLAIASVAALALGVAACGSSDENGGTASGGSSAGGAPITITVQTFGGGKNFGYKTAVDKWNASHTDIKIKNDNLTDQFEQVYWPQMIQWLQSGAGAGDVVGIDEGGMGLAKAHPEWWADLSELKGRQADFAPWKWENGVAADGKLFALGTDIGGMSLCYRRDLFEKAGLPADRDEVSKLWPTWDDFIKVGQEFQSKVKDTKFVDGTNTLYNVVLVQEAAKNGNVSYFDQSNNLIVDKNPAVKAAYDFSVKISQEGLTAKLRNFTPEWNTGFKKSQFATLGCPSWMLGVVSGDGAAGPELKGKWDVAAVPGGGGNWGGSWLAVPKQSKHPKEAAQVLDYLTGKDTQVSVFTDAGNMPSNIQAQQDPAVQSATNEYFNNAPVGEIFAKSAATLQPVFLGLKHAQVKSAIESVISALDDGSVPYAQAWQKLVDDAVKAAG
jgi:cellobiose transport system substrate-binding protein